MRYENNRDSIFHVRLEEPLPIGRLYLDRIAGGDRHHCDSGRVAGAGLGLCEILGEQNTLLK